MKNHIQPYADTTTSDRIIDEFPITGKLIEYRHMTELQIYKLSIESLAKSPKTLTHLYINEPKNFELILNIMKSNHSITCNIVGESTDSLEQPDGTYQSLPRIIQIVSGYSSFQSEGLERVVFER